MILMLVGEFDKKEESDVAPPELPTGEKGARGDTEDLLEIRDGCR